MIQENCFLINSDKFPTVWQLNHPVTHNALSVIRNKNTSAETFLNASERIASLLLMVAFQNLPLTLKKLETPLTTCDSRVLDDSYKIVLAPILRAGLGLSQTATKLLPEATVYHIGMYRDEETRKPVCYYNKTPASFPLKTKVFVLDPMLATGNSAIAGVNLFAQKGVPVQDIVFVSVLSAPEGLEKLLSVYPKLKVITAQIDEKLNNRSYILPGLGDFGDRFFQTL